MTEAEWLTRGDPTPMIRSLEGEISERKLRLFAVASCSHSLLNFYYPDLEAVVEWGERFADGLVKLEDSESVMCGVFWAITEPCDSLNCLGEAVVSLLGIPFVSATAERVVLEIAEAHHIAEVDTSSKDELIAQSCFLRDIFGNPFRPVTVDRAWLTSTVVALAEGIYADRAFDRMPILADALQDAGCESDDILDHCRGPGPHVRGCWVVDLVLGKE